MGFHTRHLSKEAILAHYKNGGTEAVLNLYKADAIISSDDISIEITNIVHEYYTHKNHDRLIEEVREKLEACS